MADKENQSLGTLNITGPVVVIDDDPAVVQQVQKFLEAQDINVAPFESGTHAARYMESMTWRWVPSLVITDIAMDGLGGYQLMRRIAELYPKKNIPIIVISQHTSADYIYEAEVAGAGRFVKKPLDMQELEEAIIQLTSGKKITELTQAPE